jgi:hypothetical protein
VVRAQHFTDSQRKKVKEHNCSNSRFVKRFDLIMVTFPSRRHVARAQHFADSQEGKVKEGSRENSRHVKF